MVVITVGLPGCGKSTWAAKNLPGLPRLERDMIREEISQERGQPFSWESWDLSLEGEVTRRWMQRLESLLASGEGFVVSDTSLHTGYRRDLAARLRAAGREIRYVFFDVQIETCRARNAGRGPRRVADVAYDRLLPGFREAGEILSGEAAEFGASLEVVRG